MLQLLTAKEINMTHLFYVSERNKINLNSTAPRIECVDPVTFNLQLSHVLFTNNISVYLGSAMKKVYCCISYEMYIGIEKWLLLY